MLEREFCRAPSKAPGMQQVHNKWHSPLLTPTWLILGVRKGMTSLSGPWRAPGSCGQHWFLVIKAETISTVWFTRNFPTDMFLNLSLTLPAQRNSFNHPTTQEDSQKDDVTWPPNGQAESQTTPRLLLELCLLSETPQLPGVTWEVDQVTCALHHSGPLLSACSAPLLKDTGKVVCV